MKTRESESSPPRDPEAIVRALRSCETELRQLPVSLAYLHGSYARGTPGPLSDVDVAVLFRGSEPPSFDAINAVQEALERAVGESVDLAVLNIGSPLLRFRVIDGGRPIFSCGEDERIRFEMTAQRDYWDTEYLRRFHRDALFRRIREGRFLD